MFVSFSQLSFWVGFPIFIKGLIPEISLISIRIPNWVKSRKLMHFYLTYPQFILLFNIQGQNSFLKQKIK
jgi:hypothetical protein